MEVCIDIIICSPLQRAKQTYREREKKELQSDFDMLMKSLPKLYMNYQDKKELIKEIKIELFIDDSVKFCEDMENLGIKTFIMSSRINKEINTGKAIRVKNWIEIYEKICTNEDK